MENYLEISYLCGIRYRDETGEPMSGFHSWLAESGSHVVHELFMRLPEIMGNVILMPSGSLPRAIIMPRIIIIMHARTRRINGRTLLRSTWPSENQTSPMNTFASTIQLCCFYSSLRNPCRVTFQHPPRKIL